MQILYLKNMSNNQVISYLSLRRSIGILGIALPIVVAIGSIIVKKEFYFEASISKYYYTDSRNIFVAILSAVALFMFAYRGYDRKDRIAGKIASISALGIALFPTNQPQFFSEMCQSNNHIFTFIVIIHYISAITFFIVLGYFSLFLFTRTTNNDTKNHTLQKKQRNIIYKVCGYIIWGSIALLIIYTIFKCKFPILHKYHFIFWIETLALFAFGASWLVKGKFILEDK